MLAFDEDGNQISAGPSLADAKPERRSSMDIALSGVQRLIDDPDLRMTPEQAAGVMGNLWHESGGFKQMQEIKPVSGRGGFGWAQWTGPRRRQFEEFVKANNLDPTSDDANFQFLKQELLTSERPAFETLKRSGSLDQATTNFMGQPGDMSGFERPGVPALGARRRNARQILAAWNGGVTSDASPSDGGMKIFTEADAAEVPFSSQQEAVSAPAEPPAQPPSLLQRGKNLISDAGNAVEDFAYNQVMDPKSVVNNPGQTAKNLGSAALSGVYRGSEGVLGTLQAGAEATNKYLTGPVFNAFGVQDPVQQLAQTYSKARQGQKTIAERLTPQADSDLASGVYSGMQSITQNLMTIPAAVVTGNPLMALAPMGVMSGGQSYGEARDAGKSPERAALYGTTQGIIEVGTETIPMGKLLGSLKANDALWKTFAKQLVPEMLGEQAATFLQDLDKWVELNPDKTAKEFMAERPSAAIQTAVATLVGTGGQVLLGKAADAAAKRWSSENKIESLYNKNPMFMEILKTETDPSLSGIERAKQARDIMAQRLAAAATMPAERDQAEDTSISSAGTTGDTNAQDPAGASTAPAEPTGTTQAAVQEGQSQAVDAAQGPQVTDIAPEIRQVSDNEFQIVDTNTGTVISRHPTDVDAFEALDQLNASTPLSTGFDRETTTATQETTNEGQNQEANAGTSGQEGLLNLPGQAPGSISMPAGGQVSAGTTEGINADQSASASPIAGITTQGNQSANQGTDPGIQANGATVAPSVATAIGGIPQASDSAGQAPGVLSQTLLTGAPNANDPTTGTGEIAPGTAAGSALAQGTEGGAGTGTADGRDRLASGSASGDVGATAAASTTNNPVSEPALAPKTPDEVVAYYFADQNIGQGGALDDSARTWANRTLKPTAMRVTSEWRPTQQFWKRKSDEARQGYNRALKILVDSGYAQIAWDIDGNPHYAKAGSPVPDGLYTEGNHPFEKGIGRDIAPAMEVAPSVPTQASLTDKLKAPGVMDGIADLVSQAGWAQKGGHLYRDANGKPNRTTWLPKQDWWMERPDKTTQKDFEEALRRLQSGEKLSPKHERIADFLYDLQTISLPTEDIQNTGYDDLDPALADEVDELIERAMRELGADTTNAIVSRASENAVGRSPTVYLLGVKYGIQEAFNQRQSGTSGAVDETQSGRPGQGNEGGRQDTEESGRPDPQGESLFPAATAEDRARADREALAEAQKEQQRKSNATQAPPADDGLFAQDNRQDQLKFSLRPDEQQQRIRKLNRGIDAQNRRYAGGSESDARSRVELAAAEDVPAARRIEWKLASAIAAVFKHNLIPVRGENGGRLNFDGVVDPNGDPSSIFITVDSVSPISRVVAHELLHGLRLNAPKIYDNLVKSLRQLYDADALVDYVNSREYAGELTDANEEEWVADFVSNVINSPDGLVRVAFAMNRNKAGSGFNFLRRVQGLVERIKQGLAGTPLGANKVIAKSDLQKAEDAVVEALAQYAAYQEKGTQPSGKLKFSNRQKATKPAFSDSLVTLHNLTEENLAQANAIGGLPAPSLGITKASSPFTGFGEITLIGDRGLIDPESGTPVFDRDAWTSRFPEFKFKKIKASKADALYERMKPARSMGDDGAAFTSDLFDRLRNDRNPSPDRVAEPFTRYLAPKMLYARDVLGKPIKIPTRDYSPTSSVSADPDVLAFYKANEDAIYGQRDTSKEDGQKARDELAKLIGQAIDRIAAGKSRPAVHKEAMRLNFFSENGEISGRGLQVLGRDAPKIGTRIEDTIRLTESIQKVVPDNDPTYLKWVKEQVSALFDEPTITLRGRQVPPTLDNLVAAMTTGATQGAEKSMTFGSGKASAHLGKQFQSIAEIQAARSQVVSEEEEADGRRLAQKVLENYQQHVVQFYGGKDYRGQIDTWAGLNDAMEALAKAGKLADTDGNIRLSLQKKGFRKVDAEAISLARQAIKSLRDVTTNYFEAKPQRAVKLNEFSGAVAPKSLSPDSLEILESNGLKVELYGKGDGAREKAIAKLSKSLEKARGDVLFSNRPKQTETPEFKRWFAGSKVVDENGDPLVVYHGSFKGADFNVFKESKNGVVGRGIYLTPFNGNALQYGESLYTLYAKVENPLIIEYADIPMGVDMRARAEALGHDGIIVKSKMREEEISELTVFSPNQIKSATDNTGAFDPENDSIIQEPLQDDLFRQQLDLFLDADPAGQSGPKTQAAKQSAVSAVEALRRSDRGVLGARLADTYAARQRVSLVGHTLTSREDLATLAQVYRDTRFETFRLFFTNQEGKIVSQVGLTSRLPASSAVIVGTDVKQYMTDLAKAASKVGATHYYMLHNHPSTNPMPSEQDVRMTQLFDRELNLISNGHVVIDTNQFGFIKPSGDVEIIKKDFGQVSPYTVNEFSGTAILNPESLIEVAKKLEVDQDAVTLVVTTAQHKVLGVTTVPADTIRSGSRALRGLRIRKILKSMSGAKVFAVGTHRPTLLQLGHLVMDAIHINESGEYVSVNKSMSGAYGMSDPFQIRGRQIPRVTADTSPEFDYLRDQTLMARGGGMGSALNISEPKFSNRPNPTFYSQLARGFESSKMNSMPGSQWRAWLFSNKAKMGIKDDEIAWTGIEDYLTLNGKEKLTKADIASYLADNGVRVEEVMKGGDIDKRKAAWSDLIAILKTEDNLGYDRASEAAADLVAGSLGVDQIDVDDGVREKIRDSVDKYRADGIPTKYDKYTIPGGQNYRELLITLPYRNKPVATKDTSGWEVMTLDENRFTVQREIVVRTADGQVVSQRSGFTGTDEDAIRQAAEGNARAISQNAERENNYRSSHWDEKNVLAHLRFDERTDADGNKVMFIQELQSDWGQEGKKRGFATKKSGRFTVDRSDPDTIVIRNESGDQVGGYSVNSAYGQSDAQLIERYQSGLGGTDGTIPQAPFVTDTKSWLSLGLKRAIRYAAENGFDKIAFANGQQNADLYDLSKQVKSIAVPMVNDDGSRSVRIDPENGTAIKLMVDKSGVVDGVGPSSEQFTGKTLDDVVGKEIADRILSAKEPTTFSGEGLKVGGEGMRKFYDQIVPQTANDVLKKLGGGRVGQVKIGGVTKEILDSVAQTDYDANYDDLSDRAQRNVMAAAQDKSKAQSMSQPGFDITPALQDKALDGMPLFSNRRKQTETPEFKKWFWQSKVVDESGKPLVVYHGTKADISAFDPDQIGSNFGLDSEGFFFSGSAIEASGYADPQSQLLAAGMSDNRQMTPKEGANVSPVYLSLQNPLTINTYTGAFSTTPEIDIAEQGISLIDYFDDNRKSIIAFAKDGGHDGVLFQFKGKTLAVAFRPSQIKSAIGNNGEFDANNPDIRFSNRRNVINQPALATWTTPDDSKLDNYVYLLQDKHIDTKRIVEKLGSRVSDAWDPYLKETLYHGRAAKDVDDFKVNEIKPLLQAMSTRGITIGELETFLHNRHAKEANEQIARINPAYPDGGSGILTQDAQDYLANLPAGKRTDLEALAAQIDAITAGTRRLLVDSGLETQETIDAWEATYADYVPLQRESEDVLNRGMGTGQGFSTKGPASRRRTGSGKAVVDILANVMMQRERAFTRAEKNKVGLALYGLAIQNPNPEFWYPVNPDAVKKPASVAQELVNNGMLESDLAGIIQEPTVASVNPRTGLVEYKINPALRNRDNVLAVRIKGKDRFLFFSTENERAVRMAQSLKNLDAPEMHRVLNLLRYVTRYVSSINTQYNPIFGVVNLLRDTQGAMLNLSTTPIAGKQAEVAAKIAPAMAGIYGDLRADRKGKPRKGSQWSQLWEEFQTVGGKTGYRDMYATADDRMKALEKELKAIQDGKVKRLTRGLFDWLSDYNETLENAVRLSAYKVGTESGMSKERAAVMAKELTVNFNRKGLWASEAGALWAFFNAAVQGTARLAETVKGPAGKKIVAGGLIMGVVQAMIMAAAGYDDDEPPEFLRERNFIIPMPNGKYVSIPMPLGFHVLPNTGRVLTEIALNPDEGGKKMIGLLASFMEAFNPIGSAKDLSLVLSPTVSDPIVSLDINRDAFGKEIAKKDRSSTSPTPGFTRTKDTASWLSKQLAWGLNRITGGTDYTQGALSPTPDQLDYVFSQATGGVGREVMKIEQAASAWMTGEELPPYKYPLGVGRFVGDVKSQSAESNRFYANLTRLNELESEIKGRAKDGKDVAGFLRSNPLATLVPAGNQMERAVSELRSRKRKLIAQNAPKATIKALEGQIATQMKVLNDRVKAVAR